MRDLEPPELPPLGRRSAAALALWLVAVSVTYLVLRELGLSLLP